MARRRRSAARVFKLHRLPPRHRRRNCPRSMRLLQPAAIGTAETTAPNLSCFANTPRRASRDRTRKTPDHHISRCRRADQMHALQLRLPGNHHRQFTSRWTSDYPGIASSALEQAGIECAVFMQGASEDVRPYDWWEGNTDISHAERTSTDAQALGLLLATQAIRARPA